MHFAGSFPASCDFSVLPCEPTGLCSSERIYPEKNRVGKSPQQCHMLCSCVLLAGLAASTSLCFVLKIHFKRFGWFRNDNRDSHPWCEGHWLCHTASSPVPQRCLTRHRFQCEELISGRSPEGPGSEITGSEAPQHWGDHGLDGPAASRGCSSLFTFANPSQHLYRNFANWLALSE